MMRPDNSEGRRALWWTRKGSYSIHDGYLSHLSLHCGASSRKVEVRCSIYN